MNRKHFLILILSFLFVGLIACGKEVKLKEDPQFSKPILEDQSQESETTNKSKGRILGHSDSSKGKTSSSSRLDGNGDPKPPITYLTEHDVLNTIGTGDKQTDLVCQHHRTARPNPVIKAFCIDNIKPSNIYDLQKSLGLAIVNENLVTRAQNGTGGNPAFAFLGHSTSLVGRLVSALNPRAIIFTPPDNLTSANLDFVIMSFVRGDQLIELAAFDGQSKSLEFYLLKFTQACNLKKEGCSLGELLTFEVEKNWIDTTLYAMDQLSDTILDCTHCHQPLGPSAPRSLRMQEIDTPWSHWFSDDTLGIALINDYYAMRDKSEIYGGIPGSMVSASRPELLDIFIKKTGLINGQINVFRSAEIEKQITDSNPRQPGDNTLPGVSSTWMLQYEQSKKSLLPPIPYHDLKITEFGMASRAVFEYQSYQRGNKTSADLNVFNNIFKADQNLVARMGFAIEREASAQEILERSCGQCHNSRLDQNLTKSKFNVLIEQIKDRNKILDKAIYRVQLGYSPERLKSLNMKFVLKESSDEISKEELPIDQEKDADKEDADETFITPPRYSHALTMPPARFRQLTDEQIDTLVQFFESKKTKN